MPNLKKPGKAFELLSQASRFLVTGGLATLLDLAVFMLLGLVIPEQLKLRFVFAFSVSVACRFLADKVFTFNNSSKLYSRQFSLYVLSCLFTMLVGLGAFNISLHYGASPFWAKIISIPCVTVAGFFLFRFVVFRK